MFKPEVLVSLRAASLDSDYTQGGTPLDLGPYVNAGKRQITAIWAPAVTGTDTDETYNNKLQESATTASSDFSDISGAAFSEVSSTDTLAWQSLTFVTNQRYVRSYATIAGTTPTMIDFTALLLTARFDT